ncbi:MULTISPECIES: hypothetical protein [Moraxella]|uniref:Uncharacterized protein n=1 Tax=Moraxella lacunata TaxID=477 RepID=A0A1B8PWF5_MORLA|nr:MULTISPECIES: hypothetical protein [Moraxella]MBE9577786.1 hypothetical protein [Moraxella sp. K1664]MBE9587208.1 hypothetical protein [Moraxella sp. K1630]MBE9589415.1 hypothetical protein [Moraxella sp. K127]MBE9595492.1 hypothetical protein [Moraxella sp. K2450]MDH9217953.1 hypothetical protein [Moraxella lacunata]
MILDIPPIIEQNIAIQAQKQGMSANEWAISILQKASNPDEMLLADFIKNKQLNSFQGNPTDIQKAMRDEWQ